MADIKNIIGNGSRVKTKIGKVDALVIGVCVRGAQNNQVEYHISRYANGEHKSEWVQSFEIEPNEDNSKPPGFNNQKRIK